MTEPVFLLLGSNLGASEKILDEATVFISRRCGEILATSARYRSQAWGFLEQNDFINQVIMIRTSLPPRQLLDVILQVEKEAGRQRQGPRWQARTLDIDILFYAGEVMDLPELKIPHPRIPERNFTLVPLMEIARDFVHPGLGVTVEELYLQSTDTLEVQMIES